MGVADVRMVSLLCTVIEDVVRLPLGGMLDTGGGGHSLFTCRGGFMIDNAAVGVYNRFI